jgi:hypothetical protein
MRGLASILILFLTLNPFCLGRVINFVRLPETDPCFTAAWVRATSDTNGYADKTDVNAWNNTKSHIDANQAAWNNAASRLDANQAIWNAKLSTETDPCFTAAWVKATATQSGYADKNDVNVWNNAASYLNQAVKTTSDVNFARVTVNQDSDSIGLRLYGKTAPTSYGEFCINSLGSYVADALNNMLFSSVQGGIYFRSSSGAALQFNDVATATGGAWFFQSCNSGKNPYIRQSGYITAAAGADYIQWQVNDTSDFFELSRQDANILGFKINMPLNVADTLQVSATATFGGNVVPDANNTRSLGTSGAKWSDIYAVNTHFGDLIAANNFRITESNASGEPALIFKNQKGVEIMRLDEEGNLHIKGKIIWEY